MKLPDVMGAPASSSSNRIVPLLVSSTAVRFDILYFLSRWFIKYLYFKVIFKAGLRSGLAGIGVSHPHDQRLPKGTLHANCFGSQKLGKRLGHVLPRRVGL